MTAPCSPASATWSAWKPPGTATTTSPSWKGPTGAGALPPGSGSTSGWPPARPSASTPTAPSPWSRVPPTSAGTRASIAMQAAEVLGIAAEDVHPSVGDTDSVGYTFLTGGSRTTFATGWAAYECAQGDQEQDDRPGRHHLGGGQGRRGPG